LGVRVAAEVKPPTALLGHVDQNYQWNTILADWAETIGDVMWPTSVWTYSQMRRDPRLTAILNSYTLLLRHATWQVNPAGCRDEVVQLVADDLGLPIVGDDQPGPARVRGVSWPQHVRMALLDLVYGHMGFEMAAEIKDGQARLTTLAERMPSSISQIHVTTDGAGAFDGISQWSLPGSKNMTPDIPANRMVWYAHEREGSQWQGHSLLRSAYAPWLLKREMQRVHATSNRRFGMGIPVVRWLPGTSPTPAQHAAAQQIAETMRSGDQAGAALPPGAIIELVGLSGSVPDTQGFLDWLNKEMAIATLTQFLDLGSSQSGSRALGTTFVDFFMLAAEAVGQETADTATRQIAARLTDWNWGDQEPVPTIEVADIGARQEVTSEAINQLLLAGGITPDPNLEADLRKKYGLPQRDVHVAQLPGRGGQPPAPAPAVPPVQAGGDRTDAILAHVNAHPAGVRATDVEQRYGHTARKTLARLCNAGRIGRAARGLYVPRAASGQSGQGTGQLRREPSPEEEASGVDFAGHAAAHTAALAGLVQQWPAQAQPVVDELAADADQQAQADSPQYGTLTASSAALAAVLVAAMTALAGAAALAVVAEAAHQGVTVTAPAVAGLPELASTADTVAALIVSGLASSAGRAAMAAAGTDVAEAVSGALAPAVTAPPAWVSDNLAQALTVAQAAGRDAAMAAAPVAARYYASEVLDQNTCNPCYDVDGKLFADLAAAQAEYAFGGYRYCEGGLRCRGIVIARWEA
jgi:hypothetical protein